MQTIDRHVPHPHTLTGAQLEGAPRLVLPFAERSKSRLRATLPDGEELAIFLPRGTVLRGGDVLLTTEGRAILVEAAPEAVLQVEASDPLALLRAAYHLGNRHIPVEIGRDHLRLELDPVLADMLARLDVHARRADLPFEPEAGAYGGGHRHGHDATFADDYQVAQAAFAAHHGHAHEHAHEHPHEHDHPHEHGHDHEHDHAHAHPHAHEPSGG